jgi:hypothetical protein
MTKFFTFALAFVLCGLPLLSWGVPIDLTTFDADPTVVIVDPYLAYMYEDPDFDSVWLWNDFLSSDLPAGATTVDFGYFLEVPELNQDVLYIGLYDYEGSTYLEEMWIEPPGPVAAGDTWSASGDVSWSLGGSSDVGLEFQLNSYPYPNDQGLESWAMITSTTAIPEASTLILFGSGGLSLLGLYRPFRRRRRG